VQDKSNTGALRRQPGTNERGDETAMHRRGYPPRTRTGFLSFWVEGGRGGGETAPNQASLTLPGLNTLPQRRSRDRRWRPSPRAFRLVIHTTSTWG
jgi:hypothetical protein